VKIVWSPEAADDLETAVEYLAQDKSDSRGKAWAPHSRARRSPRDRTARRPKHVLKTGQTVRGWPFPPFRVYYQRTEDALLIVRVYHQKREPIAR
jgi:plasmid stabilization system protein ParE